MKTTTIRSTNGPLPKRRNDRSLRGKSARFLPRSGLAHSPWGTDCTVFKIAPAASVSREPIHLGGKRGGQPLSIHFLLHSYMTEDARFQSKQHSLSRPNISCCIWCRILYIYQIQLTAVTIEEVQATSDVSFWNTRTDVLVVLQFKMKNYVVQNPTKGYSRWSLLLLPKHR